MIVLIEHPEHGRMHVYSILELERHQALGWSIVPEKREEQVVQQEVKKLGRPFKK